MKKSILILQFCVFAFLQIHAQTPANLSINSDGTTGILTDERDGQRYKAVLMPDGYWWMTENLRYRNGLNNPIFGYLPVKTNIASPGTNLQRTYYCPGPGPFANSPNTTTTSQADPLSCEYKGCLYPFWTAYGQNNGTSNVYGSMGAQGVCPNGWHLPSDNEWSNLATTALNNLTNLSVLAVGKRDYTGVYADNTAKAYFWTSTGSGTAAVSRSFSGGTITRNVSQPASDALSVRCKGGKCIETSQIMLSMVSNMYGSGCRTYVEAKTNYDTIIFSNSSIVRIYDIVLTPTLSTGMWTYSALCCGLPPGVACISSPSASQITLNITGLSASNSGKFITLKIVGFNPNYCILDTQNFVIELIHNPSLGFSLPYVAAAYSGASTASMHVINAPGADVNGATGILTDGRDGKTYTTKKMPDGQWWMTKNLEVGTCPNGNTGWSLGVKLAWGSTTDQPSNWNINGVALRGKCRQNGTYGYLYNWIAATQFPDGCAVGQNCPVSNWQDKWIQGICPEGWRLPTGGSCGDFQYMPNSSDPAMWLSIWSGLYGGQCNSEGNLLVQGTRADYWSSTQEYFYTSYRLGYSANATVNPMGVTNKDVGLSVRCVKN